LFVHAKGSLLGTEDREFERINKRVNKIFNHSRNQLDSLEKYNQYLENRDEICYKLFKKIDLPDTEACVSSFELNNRNSIAQNNMIGLSQMDTKEKNTYIIEEYKRLSRIKLKRERLVDQYYRSYIDEKEFSMRTQSLETEMVNSSTIAPVQNLVDTEIKDSRSYSYTPEFSKTQQIDQSFQFPKPLIPDMTLEKARHLSSKKLNNPELFSLSKEAGGWSSNMVMSRYKEYAFNCLFT